MLTAAKPNAPIKIFFILSLQPCSLPLVPKRFRTQSRALSPPNFNLEHKSIHPEKLSPVGNTRPQS